MDSVMMSVKNTFVHLDEQTGPAESKELRRSSSVPRSWRPSLSAEDIEPITKELSIRAPSSCAEDSTEAELSEADNESFGSTPPPSPRGSCASGNPTLAAVSSPVSAGAMSSPLCSPTQVIPMMAVAMVPMSQPAAASGAGTAQPAPRQKLSSKAQAWTPGGGSSRGTGVSSMATVGSFVQHVAIVIATTVSAIKHAAPRVADVKASMDKSSGATCWNIAVALTLEDFEKHREQVLTLAQQALAGVTQHTSGVHLLGSMSSPFMRTQFGRSATLGAVADESKACWDSIAYGCCPRGHCCRWQHPMCHATVQITVKIEEAD